MQSYYLQQMRLRVLPDKINYLLYLDTDLNNITAGAWAKDAILGLKHLFKWNKVAVVFRSKRS
jgi:hypothetical protein